MMHHILKGAAAIMMSEQNDNFVYETYDHMVRTRTSSMATLPFVYSLRPSASLFGIFFQSHNC